MAVAIASVEGGLQEHLHSPREVILVFSPGAPGNLGLKPRPGGKGRERPSLQMHKSCVQESREREDKGLQNLGNVNYCLGSSCRLRA